MTRRHEPSTSERVELLRHRIQRQRRRRGASMVEGLVVVPFFMLIFAGTMFVGGLYAKRIHLQNQVREETWRLAVSDNCDDVADPNLENLEIVDSSDLGDLSTSPLAALCDKDFGSVTYTAKDSHDVAGPFSWANAGKIAATGVVPCNETPIPGDVAYESAVQFLWDAYQTAGTIPPDAQPPTSYPIIKIFGGVTLYGGGGYYGGYYY